MIRCARATLATMALLASAGAGLAREVTVHPMTGHWYSLAEAPSPEGFVTFRRYAVFLTKDINGATTSSGIRNVLLLHCSLSGDRPSYLNFAVPEEVDVPALLGAKHLANTQLSVGAAAGDMIPMQVEVLSNEVFADFGDQNDAAIREVVFSPFHILVLTSDFGIGFQVPEDGGKFDGLIEDALRGNGLTAEPFTAADVMHVC